MHAPACSCSPAVWRCVPWPLSRRFAFFVLSYRYRTIVYRYRYRINEIIISLSNDSTETFDTISNANNTTSRVACIIRVRVYTSTPVVHKRRNRTTQPPPTKPAGGDTWRGDLTVSVVMRLLLLSSRSDGCWCVTSMYLGCWRARVLCICCMLCIQYYCCCTMAWHYIPCSLYSLLPLLLFCCGSGVSATYNRFVTTEKACISIIYQNRRMKNHHQFSTKHGHRRTQGMCWMSTGRTHTSYIPRTKYIHNKLPGKTYVCIPGM